MPLYKFLVGLKRTSDMTRAWSPNVCTRKFRNKVLFFFTSRIFWRSEQWLNQCFRFLPKKAFSFWLKKRAAGIYSSTFEVNLPVLPEYWPTNLNFYITNFAQLAVEYTDWIQDPPNEGTVYGTKQSDGEVIAMVELWGMRSTPLLLSLPGPLSPGVVAPDRALSMG